MKSFVVNKNDAEQRLDKFVMKAAPSLPKALMYKYIRIKRIKVNGKRAENNSRFRAVGIVVNYVVKQLENIIAEFQLGVVYKSLA